MGKLNLCLLVSYFMFVSLLSTFVLIGYLSNISLKMNSPQILSFKTLDPTITSCEDIEDMLCSALDSQYSFKKRVSPLSIEAISF